MAGVILAARRMEPLVERLCEDLERERRELADPFAGQRVLVGSQGMMRWLRAQIATRTGACINVLFDYIASGLARALRPGSSGTDVLTVEQMALLLLGMVTGGQDDPRKKQVREHFESFAGEMGVGIVLDAPLDDRALAASRLVAELLDRLLVYRPGDASGWLELENKALERRIGTSRADLIKALWAECCRLHERGIASHLFQLHADTTEQRTENPAPDGGPVVHVFGLASLPPLHFEILKPMLESGSARLYLLAPLGRAQQGDGRNFGRGEALGKLSLHFLEKIESCDGVKLQWLDDKPVGSDSFLSNLQRAMRDQAGGEGERCPVDGSIEFHGCHGPSRQVEVLKDRLLALFKNDDTLEPRDVVVMTPDIELYGPLVQATFSMPEVEGTKKGSIPVRVVDREAFSGNRFAAVLGALVRMATRRVRAPELVELLSMEPVRERFGFTGGELADARELVRASGIRWALDEKDRKLAGLPEDAQNTLVFGAERLAAGLVAGDAWPVVLGGRPVAPVENADVLSGELAGRLLGFFRQVEWAVGELRKPRGLDGWSGLFGQLLDTFCAYDPDDRDASYEYQAVQGRLDELGRAAEIAGLDAPVDLRAASQLFSGASGAADIAGANSVTVCSFKPMRAVPFRVVCLVGMDDGAFPRKGYVSGEDLIGQGGLCCDRPDQRAEDLEVFLESVLSAGRNLVVCYTARDQHTNEVRHPAGPVEILLEAAAELSGKNKDELVTVHPLQPFSPRCFAEGGSFSRWAYSAAAGLYERSKEEEKKKDDWTTRTPFGKGERLPVPEWIERNPIELELDELVSFFKHPAKYILRKRLGVYFPEAADALAEREPVELDGLERWEVRDRILGLCGYDPEKLKPDGDAWIGLKRRLVAEGVLPLGRKGEQLLEEYREELRKVVEKDELIRRAKETELLVALETRKYGSARLRGKAFVARENDRPSVVVVQPGNPDDVKRLVEAWVRLLAIAVSEGAGGASAIIAGIDNDRIKKKILELNGSEGKGPAWARERLCEMVECYLDGLVRPVPLPPKAAKAFVDDDDCELAYVGGDFSPGDEDEYWRAIYPDSLPVKNEEFNRLAELVWKPIVDALG